MFKSTKVAYIVLAVFLFGSSNLAMAQTSLNKYKYIVIPKKFEDFKKENQYQTNTLVKYLFTKKGFTTVWEDAMPEDLANNQCSALFMKLKEDSSLFSTKTTVVLNDCNRQEVFVSKVGKSKDKDYKISYSEAITDAMTSFDTMNYKYEGQTNEPITVSFKNDVKELKEPKNPKMDTKDQDKSVLIEEATRTKQTYKSVEPVDSNVTMAKNEKATVEQVSTSKAAQAQKSLPVVNEKQNKSVLYAQEISNGFQLVDSTPKILMKILKTSKANHYLAYGNAANGVVYSENGKWYFERYEGENLIREELNIKF
ncbi:hypothetical protein JQC67_08140 [Aurantibacter crassamenti]|uniref:hypothetical protein n=1 Tax=Aurantibacter crassamenti TaxID=1837375 RepID=UPI00193A6518|nr:hypothetical protein [Aurantibacter crassamenti]MBM1106101.1 hypothetical protein [Aurantibacter crassamenti]